MIYATRRERIEAEKRQRRGRHMRSVKVGVASFATFAGVTVAGIAPAHADYTVERGDTLSRIAAQNEGVTVSSLMRANGLSSSLIYPGQRLSFSNSSSTSSSSSASSSSSSSSSNTSSRTHTVVSGDTLSRIAAKHGTSVSALMSKNGLTSTVIYPGNKLTIPGSSNSSSSNSSSSSSSASGSSSPSRSSTTSSARTHTVVSGDTLGRIAAKHGTSVSALMRANGLSSTLIYTGTQLSIPSGSSSSGSNSSTNSSTSNSSSTSKVTTASTGATRTSNTSTSGASWAVSTANSSSASYRLGANGQNNQWDCSSFSQKALSQDGKSIPRTAAAQYASAKKISKGQLRSGDLVFFGNGRVTHVAVYVGNGQIAQARNPSAGLSVNNLDSYSKYSNVIGYGRY